MIAHMTHTPSADSDPTSNRQSGLHEESGVPEAMLVNEATDSASNPLNLKKASAVSDSKDSGASMESEEKTLVDQGGRPLGPRALQTRAKILEATVALLDQKPLRDLRVIDICLLYTSDAADE